MKKITTEKGTFGIKDYNSWNELIIDANFYKLELGKSIFKLSEITEEQAMGIVSRYNKCSRFYMFKTDPQKYYNSSKESLINELSQKNIQINKNTYILKLETI